MAAIVLAAVGLAAWRLANRHAAGIFRTNDSTNELSAAAAVPAAMVTVDYRAGVLAAFRELDPAQRSMLFARNFDDWYQHDPQAALAWLRQMPPGSEYNLALLRVLRDIGKTDPQRALALAGEMAATHEQKFIYSELFGQLAQADPAAASNWVRTAPAGEARELALRAVADRWVVQDSAAALDWAGNLEDAGERSVAMESVLLSQASAPNGNVDEVIALAEKNLTGDALDRVLQKALTALIATDPQAAANDISQLPAGELQGTLAMNAARALAAQDPSLALNWLQTLPVDSQTPVLNNVLDVWLKQDATAAGKYIAAMTGGATQDAVVSRFAENWAERDPNAAITWAQSLSSDTAQSAAVISIASGWARSDAANATRWAMSLPEGGIARAGAARGAFSYWELADAAGADNYLKSLPQSEQFLLKPSTLAQR
jgi:hypothetical protein